MNTHIITFIIIATGVMSGLVIAVIALAISLEKLKEELSNQRIVYPCGCVYLSYGKFGHFVRYSGCNQHNPPMIPTGPTGPTTRPIGPTGPTGPTTRPIGPTGPRPTLE